MGSAVNVVLGVLGAVSALAGIALVAVMVASGHAQSNGTAIGLCFVVLPLMILISETVKARARR